MTLLRVSVLPNPNTMGKYEMPRQITGAAFSVEIQNVHYHVFTVW
jgi:hypothetical protein